VGRAACVAVDRLWCCHSVLCSTLCAVLCSTLCAVLCSMPYGVLCCVVQGEFPLDVIPVDDDVLSLELDGAFR